ncbi:MAG: hypothetical protein HRT61_20360 [Ekhidna sp.]|nr:hypothetical protein [Ekhidna sp.]
MKRTLLLCITLAMTLSIAKAQSGKEIEDRISLVFGTNQLMIDGFNLEGNVFWKRIAFDYSHGISLDLTNDLLVDDAKAQGLTAHIPWSTGFGIGYRFNDWLNVRAEPKWHRFEMYYEGDQQTSESLIGEYTTFTMGLGAYINWLPFKKKDNLLKGITIAPSLRWWPNVSDTLEDGKFTYANRNTGQIETHEALNIGVANTPFIFNVSIGYSIKI